ncbi:TPA: type II toxin-antitoxin system RelE/ParE family toxin [Candidatus Micrarchaeota archaeon]|nr:type II toxin-antitoxin system RelE/ParE family toxin [Candidatus Micrarchaeota archaeon]
MSYQIIWSDKSKENLKGMEIGIVRRIVRKAIELELAPYHFVEKMTDVNCWKLRVGDYRILMDINEDKKEIQILKVGHRRNVYK